VGRPHGGLPTGARLLAIGDTEDGHMLHIVLLTVLQQNCFLEKGQILGSAKNLGILIFSIIPASCQENLGISLVKDHQTLTVDMLEQNLLKLGVTLKSIVEMMLIVIDTGYE